VKARASNGLEKQFGASLRIFHAKLLRMVPDGLGLDRYLA
jgi:hypothetical protein